MAQRRNKGRSHSHFTRSRARYNEHCMESIARVGQNIAIFDNDYQFDNQYYQLF